MNNINKEIAEKILGLNGKYDETILKKEYRRLSRIYHPDNKETGNEEKFKEISSAYTFLEKHLDMNKEAYANVKQSNSYNHYTNGYTNNNFSKNFNAEYESMKKTLNKLRNIIIIFDELDNEFGLKEHDNRILTYYKEYTNLSFKNIIMWDTINNTFNDEYKKILFNAFYKKYIDGYYVENDLRVWFNKECENKDFKDFYTLLKSAQTIFRNTLKQKNKLEAIAFEQLINNIKNKFNSYKNYIYYDKVEEELLKLEQDKINSIKTLYHSEQLIKELIKVIIDNTEDQVNNLFNNYANELALNDYISKTKLKIENSNISHNKKQILLLMLEKTKLSSGDYTKFNNLKKELETKLDEYMDNKAKISNDKKQSKIKKRVNDVLNKTTKK